MVEITLIKDTRNGLMNSTFIGKAILLHLKEWHSIERGHKECVTLHGPVIIVAD